MTGQTALDLHSGDYVEAYEKKPLSRVANLIPLMDLRPTDSLVDYACGNAMLYELVQGKIKEYHGVDFSEDFIAAAKRRIARVGGGGRLYCDDIVAFGNNHPDTFDVAAALDFSEHIDDTDFVKIFSAIHRSMRVGGRLHLHTPNLDFILERLKDVGFLRQFPEHIAVRTAAQNVTLLIRSGFSIENVRVRMIPHYNILKHIHPLHRLPLFGRLFAARQFITCIK